MRRMFIADALGSSQPHAFVFLAMSVPVGNALRALVDDSGVKSFPDPFSHFSSESFGGYMDRDGDGERMVLS